MATVPPHATPGRRVAVMAHAAGEKILEGLCSAGVLTLADDAAPAAERPVGTCGICGGAFAEETLVTHPKLHAVACGLCYATADRLVRQFHEAALKEYRGFLSQLPQIVKDVRSGAEPPQFYRGLE